MPARVFYLARHGETDWNAETRWQGQTDVPLNATGRAQAASLGVRLASMGIAGIVSSDLSRARETAAIVGARIGLPIDYEDPALRERSLGVFDGLTREQCAALHPVAWRAWVEERRPPDGAEADPALAERVLAGIDRVGKNLVATLDKGPVLVVSHGGAIRAALGKATGEPPAPVPNCGVLEVAWEGRVLRYSPLSLDARTC